MQTIIPITTDDENNRDDEDDEFSCVSLEQKVQLLDSDMNESSVSYLVSILYRCLSTTFFSLHISMKTTLFLSQPYTGGITLSRGSDAGRLSGTPVRDPSRWGDFVHTPGRMEQEGEGDNVAEIETEEEDEETPVIYLPTENGSESSETIARFVDILARR